MNTTYKPYTGVEEYLKYRPHYLFNGVSMDIFLARILNQHVKRLESGKGILCDFGSGPGPYWDLLSDDFYLIIGIEPNSKLWRNCSRFPCLYFKQTGLEFFEFVQINSLNCINLWSWSINYALLSFFELYDSVKREVIVKDWIEGEQRARIALSNYLKHVRDTRNIFVFFDADSVEQQFITSIWEKVAPFPFKKRSFTRLLFEEIVNDFAANNQMTFSVQHLNGFANYGSLESAACKINNFHLRSHFLDDATVQADISKFLDVYKLEVEIFIPSGCYIYELM